MFAGQKHFPFTIIPKVEANTTISTMLILERKVRLGCLCRWCGGFVPSVYASGPSCSVLLQNCPLFAHTYTTRRHIRPPLSLSLSWYLRSGIFLVAANYT